MFSKKGQLQPHASKKTMGCYFLTQYLTSCRFYDQHIDTFGYSRRNHGDPSAWSHFNNFATRWHSRQHILPGLKTSGCTAGFRNEFRTSVRPHTARWALFAVAGQGAGHSTFHSWLVVYVPDSQPTGCVMPMKDANMCKLLNHQPSISLSRLSQGLCLTDHGHCSLLPSGYLT